MSKLLFLKPLRPKKKLKDISDLRIPDDIDFTSRKKKKKAPEIKEQPLSVLDIFSKVEKVKLASKASKTKAKKETRKQGKLSLKQQLEEEKKERTQIYEIKKYVEENGNVDPAIRKAASKVLDESQFPLAKNFIDFLSNPVYLEGVELRAKQIEAGINLLTDYCPRCSDVHYAQNIPSRHKLKQILNNITMLVHGKCPKCKITRSQIWKRKLLKRYDQLAGLAGQRCITGDSLVLTAHGLVPIKDFQTVAVINELVPYTAPYKLILENKRAATPAYFMKSEMRTVYTVHTKNGMENTGTSNHPILTQEDFIETSNIVPGHHYLPIHYGQNSWARTVPVCYRKLAWQAWVKSGATRKLTVFNTINKFNSTNTINERMARFMGYFIAEGHGYKNKCASIANNNLDVLADCMEAAKSIFKRGFGLQYLKDSTKISCVTVTGSSNIRFLNELFGSPVNRPSNKKQVPSVILQSPKNIVANFLSALFEGGGRVCLRSDAIEYYTSSKTLATQLLTILHNFGIPTFIRKNKTLEANDGYKQVEKRLYALHIVGEKAVSRFVNQIGFQSDSKKELASALLGKLKVVTNKSPLWYERLPLFVKQELVSLFNEANKELKSYEPYDYPAEVCEKQPITTMSMWFNHSSDSKRIYEPDTVLSLPQLAGIKDAMMFDNHRLWNTLSKDLREKFLVFFDTYLNENVYYTPVVKVVKNKKKKHTYDFCVPPFERFMANGIVNHNSGKTQLVSYLAVYTLHRLLKLDNPPAAYGILPSTPLLLSFTAVTFKQAQQNMYASFYNAVKGSSPWFKAYHAALDIAGKAVGHELYTFKDTLFHYKHKNLMGKVEAPDSRSLRGATRWFASIDELGHFVTRTKDAMKINADEVYVALNNSLLTLRSQVRKFYSKKNYLKKRKYYDLPQPLFANVSSPTSITDKICRLVEESKDPNSTIYSFHMSSYEMNPNLTKADTAQDRKTDYVKYKRDYLAIPPMSANVFIGSRKLIKSGIDNELENMVFINQKEIVTRAGEKLTSAEFEINNEHPRLNAPKVMAIDAGYSFNSFACAILGVEWSDEDNRPIIVTDALFEIIPRRDAPIDFAGIYDDLIKPLIEELNICYFYSDRWQSMKMVQEIDRDFEGSVQAKTLSLSYQDFVSYRNYLSKGDIVYPGPEIQKFSKIIQMSSRNYPRIFKDAPISHFMLQMMTVTDIMGKKVDKADKLTDDLFRAHVLATTVAMMPGVQEVLLEDDHPYAQQEDKKREAIGILGSYGGSRRSISSSGSSSVGGQIGKTAVYASFKSPIGY